MHPQPQKLLVRALDTWQAWGYALKQERWCTNRRPYDFVSKPYGNVPFTRSAALGATDTFGSGGLVMPHCWENEAFLFGGAVRFKGQFEIEVPISQHSREPRLTGDKECGSPRYS